jgi:hypothetical protein
VTSREPVERVDHEGFDLPTRHGGRAAEEAFAQCAKLAFERVDLALALERECFLAACSL